MPTDERRDRIRAEFAGRLRKELDGRARDGAEVSTKRREYREAACLLTQFDPCLLRSTGESAATGGALVELVDDCTVVGPRDRILWALTPEVREAALRGIRSREAARLALETNFDKDLASGAEQAALAYLAGEPRPLGEQDADELAATFQAVLWLTEIPEIGGVPRVGEVQGALERARLFQPLRSLVGDSFQGRARELLELHNFVGVPLPSTVARLRQTGRNLLTGLGSSLEPPLVVHGPGGIGKSTLIAKFILDASAGPGAAFPFVYVDFDRPSISIHEPLTLIAEAARQLGCQFATHRDVLDALALDCEQAAHDQRQQRERLDDLKKLRTSRPGLGRRAAESFQAMATGQETGLVQRLAQIVAAAVGTPSGRSGPPFLLVLDSFEAAQYRGSPVLGRLWAIYERLQLAYPRVRAIASGRRPIQHPAATIAPREIELSGLDSRSATALLASCGVKDPNVAKMVHHRVGGHPLSLKLAARAVVLAEHDGEPIGRALQSVPGRRWYLERKVDQMLVQGFLYDRILGHIRNPEVGRLAHPGLVLRRVTPEIIKDVLAEPCKVEVDTLDRAVELFQELGRLDLVESAGLNTLRIRADVRGIMLRLAQSDRTVVMRAIEERAIAYYSCQTGLEARAEEIYHRLRRGENPRSVEGRWLPGVERFLVGAENDMAPRAAGFLTACLGGQAPDAVLADARQEDWERITAREVEDLLSQGFAVEAAERLKQRRPWTPCSGLYPLLVETLQRLGRCTEAREAASDAIEQAEEGGCEELQLELLRQSADLAAKTGDVSSASEDLQAAQVLAAGMGLELEALDALVARAELAGRPASERSDIEAELARGLRILPEADMVERPMLVRAVAAGVADRDPQALDLALRVVGLPDTADRVLCPIAKGIDRAVAHTPELLDALAVIASTVAGLPLPISGASSLVNTLQFLREARSNGTLLPLIRRMLELQDESGEIRTGIAEAMSVDTDEDVSGRSSAKGADES